MDPREHSRQPLVEVGRYATLAAARERALVIAARDLPHWMERDGDEWLLCVELEAREVARRELALFDAEQRERASIPAEPAAARADTLSLYVFAWLMGTAFFLQNMAGPEWIERGRVTSDAIRAGEWWRTITALTLHGDLPHVVANLATGLVFAGFLLPWLGTGGTWLGVLAAGALGNAVNAWGYRGESHASIGASTAVFGALGMLVGLDVVARLAGPQVRKRWQLVLPLGAGLALLAYLGVGEEHSNVDYMAHFWGFAVGGILGLGLAPLHLRERCPPWGQKMMAAAALAIPGAAWCLAFR